jgi:YggT family protein
MAALLFILDALFKLVIVAFLLRVLMPVVRADFRSPIGEAVLRFTNPLVLPLRRVLKPAGRVDVASIVALLLVQFAATMLLGLVAGWTPVPLTVVVQGFRQLAHTVLQFYFVVVLIGALASWVAPGNWNPALRLIDQLSEPLLRPFRRLLPPIGGLDFSALFVLIGLQALQILLR